MPTASYQRCVQSVGWLAKNEGVDDAETCENTHYATHGESHASIETTQNWVA
jgi:hypothetical protein